MSESSETSSRAAVLHSDSWGDVGLHFAGRGLDDDLETAVRSLVPGISRVAWARQVHGAEVLEIEGHEMDPIGRPGDALYTEARGLALAIVTADCVPILLASRQAISAVHAGWRGIVAGIVPAALERFRRGDPREPVRAWIGPAIGVDRYEVSPEVGEQIARAAGGAMDELSKPSTGVQRPVLRSGSQGRPHADLVLAVRRQLESAGVDGIDTVDHCTFTDSARLHSYRRDGAGGGRNVSVIWRATA